MDSLLTLEELISTVLQKMDEMNYSEQTILNYKRFYSRFLEYANNRGLLHFSEDLGSQYLKTKCGCTHDTIHENSPTRKISTQVRYIRVLGDYQIHGIVLSRKLGPTATSECPEMFKEAFEGYLCECKDRNYSVLGTYSSSNRIRHFIFFMDENGVDSLDKVTPTILSDYVKTFINYSNKSVAANLVAIRRFLRYLYLNGYTHENLVESLPKIKNYYAPSMPTIWKPDELKKVLSSVDRGNPTGKRDYAILLMVARYGIRCSDIKTLKLKNLHWENNTIQFLQNKTGNSANYPMLSDVGWALIDYLKNGRPVTESECVFVRHNAPFKEFAPNSAMNRILVKYIRDSGIPITRKTPSGMHSLRHTLASTLLAENIPLPVISEILGHVSIKSTDVYLHIDHARLRECALNPEEVFNE